MSLASIRAGRSRIFNAPQRHQFRYDLAELFVAQKHEAPPTGASTGPDEWTVRLRLRAGSLTRQTRYFLASFGNFAILAAIRRASSRVSKFAAFRRPGSFSK
jgi:hypothetical protein